MREFYQHYFGVIMLFQIDGPMMRAFQKISDIIFLNMVFLLCCIPIVTIGPSVTAMYTVTLKMAAGVDYNVVKDFFRAFKSNFKQATAIWIILLAFALMIAWFFNATRQSEIPYKVALYYAFLFLSLLLLLTASYAFPLQSKFENRILSTVKNAVIMGLSHLPHSVSILLINAVPVVSLFAGEFFLQWGIPLLLGCGFSTLALISSLIFNKIFAIYIPKETEDVPLPEEMRKTEEMDQT